LPVAILLAVLPTALLADYQLPVSATSEGGGTGTDGIYMLNYTVGQVSPVGRASASTLALTTGLVPTLTDVAPPRIVHEGPTLVPERTPLVIEIDLTDDRSGIDTAVVYYHEGGVTTFRERPMEALGGDTYAATIQQSAVTERGLVYYIEARDRMSNAARFPAGAPDSAVYVRVAFTDLKSAITLPSGAYRMISLPGSTSAGPDTVLADDFGSYDPTSWRLGRWNAADSGCGDRCYDEYPDIAGIRAGRAFWLITRSGGSFDASGVSTDLSGPAAVRLERGWNQIGTPFAFVTDWLSATIGYEGSTYTIGEEHSVSDDTLYVEDNLVAYNGTYQGLQSMLEPWTGYWLYNASTQPVDLLLQPRLAISPTAPPLAGVGTVDVLLGLTASSAAAPGCTAYAGTAPDARDGWDPMDRREPPPIGDYVRAVFRHDDWGRHGGVYMTDIRRGTSDGAAWTFEVETSEAGSVTLDVRPVKGLPETWDVLVYDLQSGLRLTAGDLPHRFRCGGGRRFELAAGSDRFLSDHARGGPQLRPQFVGTSPNPFGETVRVSFFIPRGQALKLQVFSVEGRLVETLAEGHIEAGIHSVVWNGTSAGRGPVAPGIYFLRLDASGSVMTQKVLRVR
jgi:hypothetical protein